MSVAETIKSKLTQALSPLELALIDESHLHAGHAGAPESGESHFRLTVVSAAFEGASRIARQRRVNEILQAELLGSVHALTMKTMTPDEWRADRGS